MTLNVSDLKILAVCKGIVLTIQILQCSKERLHLYVFRWRGQPDPGGLGGFIYDVIPTTPTLVPNID